MGKLASEFAQPSAELMAALLRAYADEWFGHFNYFAVALEVQGPSSASISSLLRQRSDEALGRAERLAQRIIELGGRPPARLTELTEHASDKPFKLPPSLSDVEGLLAAVLDAERTSMRLQHHIHDLAGAGDPLTATLALELMADAVRGERALEALLGHEAPDMDGR